MHWRYFGVSEKKNHEKINLKEAVSIIIAIRSYITMQPYDEIFIYHYDTLVLIMNMKAAP